PAVFLRSRARILQRALLPVAAGDIFSAHEDLPVIRQPEFATRQHFADGALRGAKRMIEADKRRCLGHAVTLHHRVTNTLEELFRFRGERRSAGDERPEFPAEAAMDAPEHPGAAEKLL